MSVMHESSLAEVSRALPDGRPEHRRYPGPMLELRVGLAQINAVVGDLDGNAQRVLDAYEAATDEGCDLVVFPELMITGYPPEDLLLRPAFVAAAAETLAKIATRAGDEALVVGFPEPDGDRLYNAAAVCRNGQVLGVYRKQLLPNYAVFDEQRYFTASTEPGPVFDIAGVRVGVTICEDAWEPGPIVAAAAQGAELVVNLNASPYYAGRAREREEIIASRAREAGVPIVYVNLVGGQDELVFDGGSFVVDAQGAVVGRGRQFAEDLVLAYVESPTTVLSRIEPPIEPVREVYEALVLGTRDYVSKNGFTDVLISLSGGIDSSLVAAVAVDALGPDHVVGVMLPSRYSSEGSVADAQTLADGLGIHSFVVPIEPAHAAFEQMLAPVFEGRAPDLAEENLQARIRGNVVMTMSNKFGWMVLSCGNKSEMATGYATLYGDMAGGFAVIKDVPKTLVYALSRDRNARAGRDLIPQSVIDKAPSAELRPGQKDTDSLPDYDVLDPVIEGYVEGDESVAELAARGIDPELARRVARMVDRNEYKRRQAPPGVRVSRKAFGKDRRPPITNRWPG
jgi:NAD+ synthase (glutamine-hydrolysing)